MNQLLLINEPTDVEKFRFRLYNVKQNCSLDSSEQLWLICCMHENHSVKSYISKHLKKNIGVCLLMVLV